MISYEMIIVPVTWAYNDLAAIQTYSNNGWRMVCYSPDGKFVYFDKKWKAKNV